MSDETIKHWNSLAPALNYVGNKINVTFDERCLKQDKITYTHGTIVNIYIVYELSSNLNNLDFALENCLFRALKLTKNVILISTNILYMVLDLIHLEPISWW